MKLNLRKVAILGGSRIPFCRSHTKYKTATNQDMLTASLAGVVNRFELKNETLGDVASGAVLKHSKDWNLARESVLGCGLSANTPAFDLQRACGTSLEAAILIGSKIALGQIDSGIAAGTDTVSDAPIVYPKEYRAVLMNIFRARSMADRLKATLGFRPSHLKPETPSVNEPRTGLSMGESTERMARQWNISRADQDALALASHNNAAAAYDSGFFSDLVIPFRGVSTDNNLRRDSSLESLAKLRPAFDRKSGHGTLTAGNSTPLTDGSAAVLLASEEWAQERGHPVQAYLTHGKVAAVDFQYVGGGCGMKDVAYFIGSCLNESECERFEHELLDFYFLSLSSFVRERQPQIDVVALEDNWRAMFPLAWTDFHRFIKGWSPGHWKINGYSEKIAREVVDTLCT